MKKFKNHKGMLKRIVLRKGQIMMKRANCNKYATKRSSRSKSSRRASLLFPVQKWQRKVLMKRCPGIKLNL